MLERQKDQMHSVFEASLGYLRHGLKTNKQTSKQRNELWEELGMVLQAYDLSPRNLRLKDCEFEVGLSIILNQNQRNMI